MTQRGSNAVGREVDRPEVGPIEETDARPRVAPTGPSQAIPNP